MKKMICIALLAGFTLPALASDILVHRNIEVTGIWAGDDNEDTIFLRVSKQFQRVCRPPNITYHDRIIIKVENPIRTELFQLALTAYLNDLHLRIAVTKDCGDVHPEVDYILIGDE